jgi:HlyD family secretion protein
MINWLKLRWASSMLSRTMLVAPPVALLLLAGFAMYSRPKIEYYTRAVDRGPIEQVVSATGTINAVTTVQVGSQVSGNIAAINVDFNTKVTKGQVIAQIDPSNLKTRLLQAEADLENARANVKSLEAQAETQRANVLASKASVERARAQAKEAELQLNRTKELAAQGIMSAAQLDTAQANYDSAAANLGVTEAQLQQTQAGLKVLQAQTDQARAQVRQRAAAAEMARVDLGHTTIIAPIDGTVIARNVDVGQTVAASLQAPTLFIIAQDLTKMLVYAKTDEADVGKIRVGATARFRVDSFPRQEFRGRVSQVRMNATTVQNVVTYDTIVEFDNHGQRLFPGMTAYVTIPIESVDEAMRVPNGALRFKPDMTEEEIKAIYAKHSIPYEEPRRSGGGPGNFTGGGGPGGQGGGAGKAQGGQPGGGGPQGGAAAQSPQPSGAGASAGAPGGSSAQGGAGRPSGGQPFGGGQRMGMDRCSVVWKMTESKELEPVCLRLGVTDFTFTEVKEVKQGALKDGEKVVIGVSSGRSTATQQQRPGAPGSPMGSPSGMPRRM